MGMTYPISLDKDGKIFEIFARGGVTRNIVLDENLNIIFLTRLFNKKEFNEMKAVIKKNLNKRSEYSLFKNEEEEKKVNQNIFQDLTGNKKEIFLEYSGQYKKRFEGKIFSAKKSKIEIGVSIFEEDIASKKYDKKTKNLSIAYRHFDGVRIAILPMTKFKVPADIEKVTVFDVE